MSGATHNIGGVEEVLALSPSRVADFKACPQLFKFRALDRLPEPVDPRAARGTLVHAVLEQIFNLPPEERTEDRALEMLREVWGRLRAEDELGGIGLSPEEEEAWLGEASRLIRNYFRLEDPSHLEPQELEWWVEHTHESLLLRGIIDRVEVLPDGQWVLTDYKTGRSPSDSWSLESFFGLRFYALLCWRAFGRLPKELRLVQLGEPIVLTLVPTERMLNALERQLAAVADAVRRALTTGDWRPRPGVMCSRCPHQSVCPAWS